MSLMGRDLHASSEDQGPSEMLHVSLDPIALAQEAPKQACCVLEGIQRGLLPLGMTSPKVSMAPLLANITFSLWSSVSLWMSRTTHPCLFCKSALVCLFCSLPHETTSYHRLLKNASVIL